MIVTLTAHPALDRTVTLASPLRVGEVQRGSSQLEDAGGKGVNVARVLAAAGAEVVAALPLDPADPYRSLLDQDLNFMVTPIKGHARSNLTLTDENGTTTKINLPGPTLGQDELDGLVARTVALAEDAAWLALCGSLPPGAPTDLYARIIKATRARFGSHAPRIAVDTSGPALIAVLADPEATPDLIKPNEEELAEALLALGLPTGNGYDAPLTTALRQARLLVPQHVQAVLVTLGGDGGALVLPDAVYTAPVPTGTRVRSTVGAGDSALAGYLLADVSGSAPADKLASALRHGTATASLPGTRLATPGDLPAAPPVAELSNH
ncbi:MAG: 1-phosphofructokinase family hexose kinase [Galactobacter sp.]